MERKGDGSIKCVRKEKCQITELFFNFEKFSVVLDTSWIVCVKIWVWSVASILNRCLEIGMELELTVTTGTERKVVATRRIRKRKRENRRE